MNIRDIDLNLLKAFEALYAERNVSRAAVRLGIGQPATSNALARLRALFDDPLFLRDGRRMLPTPVADDLAIPIGRALEALREAVRPRRLVDPASLRRKFNLACGDYAMAAILPALLRRLRMDAGGVDLRVRFLEKSQVFDLLESGDLDLVLGVYPAVPKRFRAVTVFEDRFRCLIHKDHPAMLAAMTPASFAALPHLLVTERGDESGAVDEALAPLGLARRIAVTVPSVLAARRLLLESDLVATVGERLATLFTEDTMLASFAPPIEIDPWRMSAIWSRRNRNDDALAWLVRQILEVGQDG